MTLCLAALALVGCLSHPEYEVRQTAETFLSAVVDDAFARSCLFCSECPEARDRLTHVVRARVEATIDRVLPSDFPVFPDSDYMGWPYAGDAEEGVWADHPGLRKIPGDWGTRSVLYERSQNPFYAPFRRHTRRALVSYVTKTGDWWYAEAAVWNATRIELDRKINPVLLWYVFAFSSPKLRRP